MFWMTNFFGKRWTRDPDESDDAQSDCVRSHPSISKIIDREIDGRRATVMLDVDLFRNSTSTIRASPASQQKICYHETHESHEIEKILTKGNKANEGKRFTTSFTSFFR
jgi:hypothetical protein